MKILLHACCGPCSIYPVRVLRDDGFYVMAFFYRHNIHPYSECKKREESLMTFAEKFNLGVICQKGYDLEGFIRNVAFRESNRCVYCYRDRLHAAAKVAKKGKFDFFSSTLLYSKFQNHDLIKSIGRAIEKETGVRFYYSDFRKGWKEGIEESKKMGLRRQQYCGCVYSEKERYYRQGAKSGSP